MFQFLVMELGFSTLAFEANYPACLQLNNFIAKGIGTAEDCLRKQGMKVWEATEIVALINWMRCFNQSSSSRKLEFVGLDCQLSLQGTYDCLTSLKKRLGTHPAIMELEQLINRFYETKQVLSRLESDITLKQLRLTSELIKDVLSEKGSTNCNDTKSLVQMVNVLIESFDLVTAQSRKLDFYNQRDSSMAKNVQWLSKDNPKIVIWAHNSHISSWRSRFRKPMGRILKDLHGNRYFSVGMIFYEGLITTRQRWGHVPEQIEVGQPPDEFIESELARCDDDLFFLPLSSRDGSTDRSFKMRTYGAMTLDTGANEYIFTERAFDGLIFVRFSNGSTPIAQR